MDTDEGDQTPTASFSEEDEHNGDPQWSGDESASVIAARIAANRRNNVGGAGTAGRVQHPPILHISRPEIRYGAGTRTAPGHVELIYQSIASSTSRFTS